MEKIRKRLQMEHDDVATRLQQLATGAPDAATSIDDAVRDLGDHVEAHTRREMGFITRERLVERLNRLRAALDRLARGRYGICVKCGKSIAPKRLQALPDAETCLPCQEQMERGLLVA